MLNLVKLFISSNTALQELRNPYMINVLKSGGIDIPDQKTFKSTILNDTVKKVKEVINDKLNKCSNAILIADIWSNPQMTDFIGIAAVITNENLEKECFVIGLDRMPGPHTAGNIKIAVEKVVNEYDWDNTKILGNLMILRYSWLIKKI